MKTTRIGDEKPTRRQKIVMILAALYTVATYLYLFQLK